MLRPKRTTKASGYRFEGARSPRRQLELLRILHRIQQAEISQVIMATHSPILMALPGARVVEMTGSRIVETDFRQTRHFKLYQSFTADPEAFVAAALEGDDDAL